MKRGTIFFILFVIIIVGVIGVSQFLRSQPPIIINITANNIIQPWLQDEANRFNNTTPLTQLGQPIQIQISTIDDIQAWNTDSLSWRTHFPDAWIPSSTMSANFLRESGITFEVASESVVYTPLVWGAYVETAERITRDGAVALDWDAVENNLDETILAFYHPARSIIGFSAMLSAAGAYFDDTQINVTSNEFRAWLSPIVNDVPNFNTFGSSIVQTLASRGRSMGNIAIVPESEWLTNLRGSQVTGVQLYYPEYTFVFDMPYLVWQTPNQPDRAASARQFLNWLTSTNAQQRALNFGLRSEQIDVADYIATARASANQDLSTFPFANAETRRVQLQPDLSRTVTLTIRSDAQRFITWLNTQN